MPWQMDSAGNAYEVLLVGDIDSLFYRLLTADILSLPQPEPAFEVATTDEQHLNWNAKRSRNMVIIDSDIGNDSGVTIEYQHNVYAKPQIIITVKGQNAETLQRRSRAIAKQLFILLNAQERENMTAKLQEGHNSYVEEQVRQMFGCDMLIPSEMQKMKRGENFLWISNNDATAMMNICIFRGQNVDSVLRKNIKGETNEMYMTLKRLETNKVKTNNRLEYLLTSGLWEMKGDAMGGPFILRQDSDINVLAFLFAPSVKKRNRIKHLETIIHSFKKDDSK